MATLLPHVRYFFAIFEVTICPNDDDDGEEDDDHRWKSEAGSGSGLLEVCVVCRLNETRDIRLHTWLGRAGLVPGRAEPESASSDQSGHTWHSQL